MTSIAKLDIRPAQTPRLLVHQENSATGKTETELLVDSLWKQHLPEAGPAHISPVVSSSLSAAPITIPIPLTQLANGTELAYIISPDKVIFYNPDKHTMRLVQGVEENKTIELIYPTVCSGESSCSSIDLSAFWKQISSQGLGEIFLDIDKDETGFLQAHICITRKGSDSKIFNFTFKSRKYQLINQVTGLKKLILHKPAILKFSDKPVKIRDLDRLSHQLNKFLLLLDEEEEREKTLDDILPLIKFEDLLILFTYFHMTTDGLQYKADRVFKAVAEYLKLDLSEVENLLPFFQHPVEEHQWPLLLNRLTFIATGGREAILKPILEIASPELQLLVLTAFDQAVKSGSVIAISFFIRQFPFLRQPAVAEEEYCQVHYTDSEGIYQIHRFPNAFYQTITSFDRRTMNANLFLDAGYNVKGVAGAKIIQKILRISRFPSNHEEGDNFRSTMVLLAQHRLEFEFKIAGPSGLPTTIAETLFFHDNSHINWFGVFLFSNQIATLTNRVVEKMKLEMVERPEYKDILLINGIVTVDEIRHLGVQEEKSDVEKRNSLRLRLDLEEKTLVNLFRRYTANPFIEDFKRLQIIKRLKNETKLYLKMHPHDSEVENLYDSFCFKYNAIVANHYILAKLRQISLELRAYVNSSSPKDTSSTAGVSPVKHPLSNRVIALFSLWHPLAGPLKQGAIKLIESLTTTSRPTHWQLVRNTLLESIDQMNSDPFWRGKYVTCFHGTKLVPDMCKKGALYPAGMMLKDPAGAIVQFTGERLGTAFLLNKEHISCVAPAKDWTVLDMENRLQSASTPMLVSEVYANQIIGHAKTETTFNYEASKKRVEWENIAEFVFDNSPSSRKLQTCCTDILRLRAWDPSHNKYLDPLLEIVSREIENSLNLPLPDCQRRVPNLQKLFQALTVTIQFSLDGSDKELIEHPIPIVFASTAVYPVPVGEVVRLDPEEKDIDEVLIRGKAVFGEDINIAFVHDNDIERARRILTPLGLAVYPLHIAHAFETASMMKGARVEERLSPAAPDLGVAKGGSEVSSRQNLTDQDKIAIALQEEILPNYGRPLAENPSYRDDLGREHFVQCPFWGRGFFSYTSYKDAIMETTAIPRAIHGRMHAVRTAIAVQLWANFYSQVERKKIVPERLFLAEAAAAHDSQRQDEGEDYWDKASGSALHSYLASIGVPKDICESYGHALREKDPSVKDPVTGKPIFTSYEQCLIHDADVLEIMRVLRDKTSFRHSELAALALCKKNDQDILEKLPDDTRISINEKKLYAIVQEWGEFIDITEKPELKMHLEYTPSLDYYTMVMKILKYLTDRGRLGTVNMFLAEELGQISQTPIIDIERFLV